MSQRWDLNPRPHPYQGCALPTELHRLLLVILSERPGSNRRHSAWKADALPTELLSQNVNCGESRIRTCEDVVNGVTVRPRWPLEYLPSHLLFQWTNCFHNFSCFLEPMEGLEPTTCWLQISCSSQLSYIGFST